MADEPRKTRRGFLTDLAYLGGALAASAIVGVAASGGRIPEFDFWATPVTLYQDDLRPPDHGATSPSATSSPVPRDATATPDPHFTCRLPKEHDRIQPAGAPPPPRYKTPVEHDRVLPAGEPMPPPSTPRTQ